MQKFSKNVLPLVQQHLTWYPLMQARDVYKLLYQGMMGSEHLISSADEFSEYLEAEFSGLQAEPQERLFEPVRPDGSLLRLNLRPYKSHFSNVSQLIPSLLETARQFTADTNQLRDAWTELIQLCEEHQLTSFDLEDIRQFNQRVVELGYPAVHHSEVYISTYQPAYRLIAVKLIPTLGLDYES